MDSQILKEYGIDWEKGVSRFFNDENMYREILKMFSEDDTFERTAQAYNNKDNEALFKCAHELKGVCGSAALSVLYDATCALVEYLRGGNDDSAKTDALYLSVNTAYTKAKEGIALALSE